ncbi:Uma2 family endonuclease [Nocardiopsis composta]
MHVAEVESDVNHSSPWDVLLRTWEELDLPDGWRAEISQGGVLLLPPPGDDHNDIVETVQRNLYQQILLSSGEVSRFRVHQTADLRVLPLGTLFVPDLLVLPGPLRERGAEHSAADALLVVEVASPGNADRDRKTKLWGYAHGPVPLYLLIDRWDPVQGEPAATLYSKPVNGRYTNVQRVPFGEAVKLPEPFGFDLDTAEFPLPEK